MSLVTVTNCLLVHRVLTGQVQMISKMASFAESAAAVQNALLILLSFSEM